MGGSTSSFCGSQLPGNHTHYINLYVPDAFASDLLLGSDWWVFPANAKAIIAIGILTILTSLCGIFIFLRRIAARKFVAPPLNVTNIFRGYIPVLVFFWQLWLGFMLATLPAVQLSGVSMGFIYLHTVAEFSHFAMQVVAYQYHKRKDLSWIAYGVVLGTAAYFFVVTFVILTTGSPYIKGILSAPTTVVGDFGHLITPLVPLGLFKCCVPDYRFESHTKLQEFVFGVIAYLHVFGFYGQFVFECSTPPRIWDAGIFLIVVNGISLVFVFAYLVLFMKQTDAFEESTKKDE